MNNSINAIRFLGMDAINKANSGHPGIVLGAAPIIYSLYTKQMNLTPTEPRWFNRDRFVLAAGHATGMLYPTLHLAGYKLAMKDLKQFRQLNSLTPGHPEYLHTEGIDATSGPLGQGIANAVGMAIAEKILAAQFNTPQEEPIDHFTYAFLGDGCLMEGVSHEACSFAGTHNLGKLICFYDQNGISIDGEIKNWFTDDSVKRFDSYGWQTIEVDGHNVDEINEAIILAKNETQKPTMIFCRTTIGFGSPAKAGTADAHGAPLGDEEILKTNEKFQVEINGNFYNSTIIKEPLYDPRGTKMRS